MINVQGKRVLIFGDSLTHRGQTSDPVAVNVTEGILRSSAAPGDLLASHALNNGASAARIDAKVGRSAWSFYAKEPYQQLLADDLAWKPDVVIVMLGTNDVGMTPGQNEPLFTRLKNDLGKNGALVVSIGPPSFADAERTAQADAVIGTLKKVFPVFFDMRPLTSAYTTFGRAADGIHFTATGATLVASKIAHTVFGLPSVPGQKKSNAGVIAVGVVGGALALGGLMLAMRRR